VTNSNISILPCKTRLEGVKGSDIIFLLCHCKEHPSYKQRVTDDICNKCHLRVGTDQPEDRIMVSKPEPPRKGSGEPPTITPDGTLIYVQRGWQPPPCPPGYRRRSNNLKTPDAWVLEPLKPLCDHLRLVIGEQGACLCRRVVPTCVYQGRSLKVTSQTCQTCQTCKEPGYVKTP